VLPTTDYAEARGRLFPHADPDYLPSPWPWKRQRISRCDECVRAKTEWIEGHQQPNKSLQPTRDGASGSASRFTSLDPAWLSSGR
jgi:hypothetical protein